MATTIKNRLVKEYLDIKERDDANAHTTNLREAMHTIAQHDRVGYVMRTVSSFGLWGIYVVISLWSNEDHLPEFEMHLSEEMSWRQSAIVNDYFDTDHKELLKCVVIYGQEEEQTIFIGAVMRRMSGITERLAEWWRSKFPRM